MKGRFRRCGSLAKCASSTFVAVFFAWLATQSGANAAVYTLTDGNTSVGVDLNSSAGMNSWNVDGLNQMRQQWFWYRIGSSGSELDLSSISASPTVTPFGTRQVTALYNSADGTFGVKLTYQIAGNSVGSGVSGYNEQIRIYNYSAAPLDFHFFQYTDLNLQNTAGGQSANIAHDASGFTVASQNGGGASFSQSDTPSGSRGEAALYNQTLTKLTDGNPTDLNNVTSAGAGDVTWALQWDLSIAAGTSVPISLSASLLVPEPSVLALLALGGAIFARRFNRNRNCK